MSDRITPITHRSGSFGEYRKSLKILKAVRSRLNWMGRIKTCLRYMTDINGPVLPSLVDFGEGGVILKIDVFVTYERLTRS